MNKLIGLLILIGCLQVETLTAQTKQSNEFIGTLKLRQTTIVEDKNTFVVSTIEGWSMKINFLNKTMLRIQMAPASGFEPSLTEQFGFVRTSWAKVPVKVIRGSDYTIFQTDSVGIKVYKQDLRMAFLDENGDEIAGERATRSWNSEGGGCLRFSMPSDEHFFGFGFQRQTIDCRGKSFTWKREFRSQNATIPFFLSTKGYGFLSNNTWEQVFDFETSKTGYNITAIDGQLDFYFIRGPHFSQVLNNYIQLTGSPQLFPRWGFGLYYICRYFEDQKGVLDVAESFRKNDIPCDMISLEPGWEDHSYSMKWKWSPERFPDPAGMIKQLNSKGFQFGLWENGSAPDAGYADTTFRKNWYAQRLKTSINIGVGFFKQDDPYPRMLDGFSSEKFLPESEESKTRTHRAMKSLTNSLYSETAMNEFRRITGKRTFFLFNSYVSSFGSHRWPTGWAADFSAGNGLLNAGLAAQSMVSLDMEPNTLSGIHLGYLTPLALLDSWARYLEPWLYPSFITDAHRFYSKLRYRLVPYLYSTQAQSHFSGLPMMRAMVLQYQNDSVTWRLNRQYMLGDALLVGLDSSIYLPKGEWVDYWNGRRYESKGQWVKPLLKGSEGGPLFVKSGSILPMQPVTSNLQAGLPVLTTLDVFPAKQGQGCLYEDDGTSFNYEKGQSAKTDFSCSVNLNAVTINVGSRTGKFLGMPQRAYFLQVHNVKNVKSVVVNERQLKEVSTKESLLYERSQDGWWYDANKHTLFVKPGSSWRFGYDSRGEKGDTERDSLYMSEGFFSEDKGFICKIGTEFTNEPDVLLKSNIQLKPDRIVVTANPPSRVSLIDFGNNNSWLPRKTTIFVELKQGDLLVDRASNTILLEVLDENGQLLRSTEKVARNGIVIFENEKYIEEKVRFKISSKGLSSVEVTIAKPPKLQGHE